MEPTVNLKKLFNEIAAAIHEKDGLSDGIYAYNFPERIRAIPSVTNEGELESIAILTPPDKINYQPGKIFDPTGMKVYATFSSGKTVLVSNSSLTFEPSGPLEEGTTQITVSFQLGSKTVLTTQSIVVSVTYEWWSPHMTSNTTPIPYSVYSSSVNMDLYPYYAFDGNPKTMWHSTDKIGSWIAFNFGKKVKINGISLTPFGYWNAASINYGTIIPRQFSVYGSNDGSEWAKIFTNDPDVEDPPVGEIERIYIFPTPVEFSQYKIQSDSVNWNTKYTTYFTVGEIRFSKIKTED